MIKTQSNDQTIDQIFSIRDWTVSIYRGLVPNC